MVPRQLDLGKEARLGSPLNLLSPLQPLFKEANLVAHRLMLMRLPRYGQGCSSRWEEEG